MQGPSEPVAALALSLACVAPAPAAEAADKLAPRIRRIVVHVLGGPAYGRPELRFVYLSPQDTHRLWKAGFGAHWIVWTDGSLWPRRPPGSWDPATALPDVARRRLLAESAPVYAHVAGMNSSSVGVELAHSGRSADPFPDPQLRTLAWLLSSLMELSGGRLEPASIHGHKDLDRRPAYVRPDCRRPGCPVFVDSSGRPLRRRVDPPESLFAGLARFGVVVPRPAGADFDLLRAEALPDGQRAEVSGP